MPPHPPLRFPPEQQLGGWERRQSPLVVRTCLTNRLHLWTQHLRTQRIWTQYLWTLHNQIRTFLSAHCTMHTKCTFGVCKFCTYLSEIVKWLPRALCSGANQITLKVWLKLWHVCTGPLNTPEHNFVTTATTGGGVRFSSRSPVCIKNAYCWPVLTILSLIRTSQ